MNMNIMIKMRKKQESKTQANESENIESTDDKIKDESLVTEFDGLELD